MTEQFKPRSHQAPDTWQKLLLFRFRMLLDFQLLTIYRHLSKHMPSFRGKVLDIGCGNSPFKHLLTQQATYVGLDVAEAINFDYHNPEIIVFDGEHLPFESGSVQHFICTEVIEHIPDPRMLISEMHRVLAPTGTGIVTLPWSARFHFIPYDYHRYTPSMLTILFEEFGEARILARGSDINAIVSKLIVFYFGQAFGWPKSLMGIVLAPVKALLLIAFGPVLGLLVLWAHLALYLGWGSDADPLGYTIFLKK